MLINVALVHGYTGAHTDLQPLADGLAENPATGEVLNISLPGHGGHEPPRFEEEVFVNHIRNSVDSLQKDDGKIVLIGHSTGGCLLVSALRKTGIAPDLLVLINVPHRIDMDYLKRWDNHRVGREELPFVEVAKMVSFINVSGAGDSIVGIPVIAVNGEEDELVPQSDSNSWEEMFPDAFRSVSVPGGGHHLFNNGGGAFAVDIIRRAVADMVLAGRVEVAAGLDALVKVEPSVKDFVDGHPFAKGHLALSPGGHRVAGTEPELSPVADTEPVFANIEITTRCNLQCKYCARSLGSGQGNAMSLDSFRRILEMLPHAYRITLVGLGEPLLHPHVTDFVAIASSMKRRVALVTNAMLLDDRMSRDLLQAGLDSIAFSIDAPSQEVADVVRRGTDLDRVIHNIKGFVGAAKGMPHVSRAVFAAVSTENVHYLKGIVDVVADLGVHVLMLSDLNFAENVHESLCHHVDEKRATQIREAIKHAFALNLPVLSVRGIEEFGLMERYHDFLLVPPDQLYTRSESHTWCVSPWQTVPVDVSGSVTVCDCQPENMVGNLFNEPFSKMWNGKKMKSYRQQMLSRKPPEPCSICPRF